MDLNRREFIGLSMLPLVHTREAATTKNINSDVAVLDGERWWAGIITDSHLMPLTSSYSFDFYGENAGNQAQPLLISSMGRFIWSPEPFRFEFDRKMFRLNSSFDLPQVGTGGKTLRDAYLHASDNFFPPSGKIPDPMLFSHPQYNTWIELTYNQNQKDILDYAQKAVDNAFPPGVLMIDEGWEKTHGDWDFDRSKFPDPVGLVADLHKLGYKVMVWVCPFLTPEGAFYKTLSLDHINNKRTIWILNAKDPSLPVITSWWDGLSGLVDFTNPAGIAWFKEQLNRLMKDYGIDGFKLDGGDTPYYTEKNTLTPLLSFNRNAIANDHTEAFAKVGLDYPLNEYRACWKMGGQPLAQRLRDKEHNWTDIKKLVPGLINQGLMGYYFSCPDLIGGGEYLSFMNLETIDQELIVRAAQAHALAPMMQFSVAPWRVLKSENLEICRRMAILHREMGEEILQLARNAASTGEPVVRSLEYEFPNAGYVDVMDQFMLGNSILVAPVTDKGARTRVVEFPQGRWKDEEGEVIEGPTRRVIDAPLEKLPWWRKV